MPEQLTNKECIEYIVNYLKEQNIKEKAIKADEENNIVTFEFKNITYSVYIEDYETIHYGVAEIDGVSLDSDFWENYDEYGNYEYIDDFFYGIVREGTFLHISKIWNTFRKLNREYDTDQLRQLASRYFGLLE